MTRPAKLILGAATLWPLLYIVSFFAFLFITLASAFLRAQRGELGTMQQAHPPPIIVLLFALHAFTMFWTIGLLVFYVRHLFRNPAVAADRKALWAVVLLMGNAVAMPIYWYLHVWRQDRPSDAVIGASPGS